jgi:hypothetical protein
MATKKKDNRAAKIEEAIRLTWDSLESHLPWCHDKLEGWAKKRGESPAFHKKCVKDYARVITILTELY